MVNCSRCLRASIFKEITSNKKWFSNLAILQSGHNRWSKIKHEKGAADAKKNRIRSSIAQELTLASKLYGPDPDLNPRLATLISNAKKDGFPKISMNAAIARGQGQSATGNKLDNITLEAIMPPNIAFIIDCETDSKQRTLMDIRFLIKQHGAITTPTNYLFDRKGRIVFERNEKIRDLDDIYNAAIEAGAEDISISEENDNGIVVVWTEPSNLFSTLKKLQISLDPKVIDSGIIWDARKDTLTPLNDVEEAKLKCLLDLVEALDKNPDVQGIFANVAQGNLPEDQWYQLESFLSAKK